MHADSPKHLPVVLRLGEDGWIIAECPVIPGCISQGRTRDSPGAFAHNFDYMAQLLYDSVFDLRAGDDQG